MFIHNVVESTRVNGPGNRAAVWFQGCNLGCRGCWNADTHRPGTGTEMKIPEIVARITSLLDIEGVTFSGGEPMQQAMQLDILMNLIRKQRPELSFGMYTGYTEEELDRGHFSWYAGDQYLQGTANMWKGIKHNLDFAIMGRYNELKQTSEQPLCGSSNQKVVFFTNRYSEKDLSRQMVEITIAPGGLTQLTGFPVGIHGKVTRGLSGHDQEEIAI